VTALVTAGAGFLLAALPIGIAAARTFPAAVRLGPRTDGAGVQMRLARSICRDHLLCLAGITSLIAVQLTFAA
jgi:hypothetical protein